MHFPTTLALSILPLSVLGAALPPPKNETGMVAETFTTSSGEERTVYFNQGAFRDGQSENPQHQKREDFHAANEPVNNCKESRFDPKTSQGSPTVSDCECLRDYFQKKSGGWTVGRDDKYLVQLASCGSCTFGVETDNFFSTAVGNQDAADVITDSIAKFAWNGRVGAEGYMGCETDFGQLAGTDWAIFRSAGGEGGPINESPE